ncbi:MAG: S41 family peptidase [Povalibacter sp.]
MNTSHTVRLGLLLTALLTVSAPIAASPVPRDIATRAAELIDNNFYDVERARKISDELKSAAKAGEFDALKDPRDLAAKLSERLYKYDRHFRVSFTKHESERESHPSMSAEAMDRRSGYGFRRVEMLPGAIGLIDMRMFADFEFGKPNEPARTTVDAALTMMSNADAVIIDLRNNGGGSPAMVGYLVSAFTPADANIYNNFHRRSDEFSERPGDFYLTPMLNVPLYVLISGRTASAAEATAYTLQAAHRAIIVGEKSAGAANPGGQFPIGEGFNIFISTGSPMNPVTKTNWEASGVQPDVAISAEDALLRAQILALERVLAANSNSPEHEETRWILEALRVEQGGAPKGPALAAYAGKYGDASIAVKGDTLMFVRGQRPPATLVRIKDDIFFVKGESFRRVLFDRESSGKIRGFQLARVGGDSVWFPK